MGTVIDIDPDAFVAAATLSRTAGSLVQGAAATARAALASTGSMAGSDDAGVSWAEQYDLGAGAAFTQLGLLADTLGGMAVGLDACGYNHAVAEWQSAGNTGEPAGYAVPALPAAQCMSGPPSASGGSNASLPDGFEWIVDLVGLMWPDGDVDKLRAAGRAWSALADDLDALTSSTVSTVTSQLAAQVSPEVPTITARFDALTGGITDFAANCRELDAYCGSLADSIESVHRQSTDELNRMLIEVAAMVGGSIVLSFFTFGAAGVVGGAAATARVALAATRVGTWIAELGSSAAAIAANVARVSASVLRLGSTFEAATVKVLTFSGRAALFGAGNAGASVLATGIVDGADGDYSAALRNGFVAGTLGGAAGMGIASAAERAIAASAAQAAAKKAAADALGTMAAPGTRGVRWFGADHLPYYTQPGATLGLADDAVFMMPESDALKIVDGLDAAMHSGMAPSATKAALAGEPIYGASIPLDGIRVTAPTIVDAKGFEHFLPGGHTAINVGGEFIVMPTREFVVAGGRAMPPGTIIFRLIDGGDWQILGLHG